MQEACEALVGWASRGKQQIPAVLFWSLLLVSYRLRAASGRVCSEDFKSTCDLLLWFLYFAKHLSRKLSCTPGVPA